MLVSVLELFLKLFTVNPTPTLSLLLSLCLLESTYKTTLLLEALRDLKRRDIHHHLKRNILEDVRKLHEFVTAKVMNQDPVYKEVG